MSDRERQNFAAAGAFLRKCRERRDLSRVEFLRGTSLPEPTLRGYENGWAAPRTGSVGERELRSVLDAQDWDDYSALVEQVRRRLGKRPSDQPIEPSADDVRVDDSIAMAWRLRLRREPATKVDLSGEWHALWQTTVDDKPNLNDELIDVEQSGSMLKARNRAKSKKNPKGGYLWIAELLVWDNKDVMGYYVATEPNVRSKGTLYLQVHRSGQFLTGKWVGPSYDAELTWGFGAWARTLELAADQLSRLTRRHDLRTANKKENECD